MDANFRLHGTNYKPRLTVYEKYIKEEKIKITKKFL